MVSILFRMLCGWMIGTILSLYIHELGHVMVGIANGWKFILLTVGPLKIYRNDVHEKVKVGFEKNIMNWFGIGATVPVGHSSNNLHIWAKILIGGPVFSVVSGILLMTGAMCARNLFLLMFGLVSLAIGLVNAIPLPFRTGFFYNDGKRFKRIKEGGTSAREESEIMHIVEKGVIDGEKAIFHEKECTSLITSEDPIYRYYGYYILYYSAMEYDTDLAETYFRLAEALGKEVPKSVTKMFPVDAGEK